MKNDLVRITDERRTRTAAHEADTRPEVRMDLELVSSPAVEGGHAPLPDRVEAREGLLRRGDGFLVQAR